MEKPLSVYEKCCENLAEYCHQNGIKCLVTGISGGLDSAVVCGIVAGAKAIYNGITSYGVLMPCYSSQESIDRGWEVVNAFKENGILIDLSRSFTHMQYEFSQLDDPGEPTAISEGNIKARLRMMTLYDIANRNQGMVMSTDNLSEYLMGFWTLHGDVGDYGPIQMLWKGTEVYELAAAIGVPQSVIEAKPDDGLGVTDGGDEAQLGAPYEVVDDILRHFLEENADPNKKYSDEALEFFEVPGYSHELVMKIIKRCLRNSFKRTNPINISRKALGLDDYKQFT